MIGKQDWREMADQIHELETKMRSTYAQLAKNVSDHDLKETFALLGEDEARHAKVIHSLSNKIINS